MVKQTSDSILSIFGLVITSPIVLACAICVGRHPFYVSTRVGVHGRLFGMVKLRSMDDAGNVTRIGRFLRRTKIDELPQLWNVIKGDMAIVGPRPNTPDGVRDYTAYERRTLSIKPGITDFASIVFADQDMILEGAPNKVEAYDLLIRPYKSRLGVLYVENASLGLDLKIICLTLLALVNRSRALSMLQSVLRSVHCPDDLAYVASRVEPLWAGEIPQ